MEKSTLSVVLRVVSGAVLVLGLLALGPIISGNFVTGRDQSQAIIAVVLATVITSGVFGSLSLLDGLARERHSEK